MMAAGGLALAACSPSTPGQGANDSDAAAPAAPAGGVVRETPVATPTPPPPPTATVIQSQPGPEGNTVALNRVAVTGDILTVSLTYSGSGNCCVNIPLDDVSIIDDATSQRISVLKDDTGKWMAAPLDSGGRSVRPDSFTRPSVVWFKFPAPPATSRTVSIALPGTAPFDAVPVTR
jgi:hypothetical protein